MLRSPLTCLCLWEEIPQLWESVMCYYLHLFSLVPGSFLEPKSKASWEKDSLKNDEGSTTSLTRINEWRFSINLYQAVIIVFVWQLYFVLKSCIFCVGFVRGYSVYRIRLKKFRFEAAVLSTSVSQAHSHISATLMSDLGYFVAGPPRAQWQNNRSRDIVNYSKARII